MCLDVNEAGAVSASDAFGGGINSLTWKSALSLPLAVDNALDQLFQNDDDSNSEDVLEEISRLV